MKILKKFVPYKIRRALPILGLTMGSMLMPSCQDEPGPTHDTTYTWGKNNFYDLELKKKIRASADSASVRYVILKSDGLSWDGKFNENDFRYIVVKPLIEAGGEHNRHKFRGAGTIKDVYILSEKDYDWLIDFGYEIIPLPYWMPPKQR